MKKFIQSGPITAIEKLKSPNGLIVAGRSGKQVWTQNLEAPGTKIEFDDQKHELILRIPIADGEYIAIKDMDGITEKKIIEAKI